MFGKKTAAVRLFVPAPVLALAAALVTVLVATSCNPESLLPDDSGGNGDGLVVPISRLDIETRRIVTTMGSGLKEKLPLDIFPPHTTMPEKVEWLSFDDNAVKVDQNGNIEVLIAELRPGDEVFSEITVRARFTENHSVFSDMTVTVLPVFPANRELTFNNWGTAQITGTPISQMENLGYIRINLAGDWDMRYRDEGGVDKSQGILLLTGTGDVSSELFAGRATDSILRADTEDEDPKPWINTAAFLVNPASPYDWIPRPTGGARALGSWTADTEGSGAALHTGTGQPWNDPRTDGPFDDSLDPTRWGHIRTAGSGARVFQVLGLERPFEIEVRYVTNQAGNARWAGIRFGGDDGQIWVEGPQSWQTGISQANRLRSGRVMRYEWRDYLYSDNRDDEGNAFREWILKDGGRVRQDEYDEAVHGERIELDDYLAVTDVYAVNGGIRVHDIVVRPLADAGERPLP